MKNTDRIVPGLLILASIGVSVLFLYLAATRGLNNVESIFFQIFALGTGLTGSYYFGQQAAGDRARELIRPHARSAIRRLRFLSAGLGRVAEAIRGCESPADYRVTLAILRAIVVEQLAAADDALEEWADILPEDVAELRKELSTGEQGGVNDG